MAKQTDANYSNISNTLTVQFDIELLSPRAQADLCLKLLEITGAMNLLRRYSSQDNGEYQSCTSEIFDVISAHWGKRTR